MPEPFLPSPARTAGRVIVWALLAAVVLAVIATVWIGARGAIAYDHLRTAQQSAGEIAGQLDDIGAAAGAIDDLGVHTSAARDLTSDPIWAAPTIIINNEKFEKSLNYKNLKEYLEKLI